MHHLVISAAVAAQIWAGPNGPFLKRLAEVESSKRPAAIGRAGERGLYQFRERVWWETTRLPFDRAFDPAEATRAATERLYSLALQFRGATGSLPRGPQLYALWNLGFEGFRHRGFKLLLCPRITRRAAAKFEGVHFFPHAKCAP